MAYIMLLITSHFVSGSQSLLKSKCMSMQTDDRAVHHIAHATGLQVINIAGLFGNCLSDKDEMTGGDTQHSFEF